MYLEKKNFIERDFFFRISCPSKLFPLPKMVCLKKRQLTTILNSVSESMLRMLSEFFADFLKLTRIFLCHHCVLKKTSLIESFSLQDFMSIETVPFTKDGLLEKTPAHNYSEFRFRIYASHAFRVFRRLFEIDKDFFVSSLCSEPMVELSAAGASGSIFYVTRDDNFICKTVQHKEAEFLQKILPGKKILVQPGYFFLEVTFFF